MMCGIAGIVNPNGARLDQLAELAASLRHRGPDDEGYVVHDGLTPIRPFRGDETVPDLADLAHWRAEPAYRCRLGLCHRRLAILDLTASGHQPMVSADGRLALVFGGEIYNYLELADELEALGWRLRPCGDTAVLLAAFAQWGPGCVSRLRGMWAFAAYDQRSGRLTLSRDRFGIKPLYYMRAGDSLVFSSEIKGLLPVMRGAARGSTREAARLLAWGRLGDDDATLFEGVRAVPAGCNIHVNTQDATTRVERYYDIDAASSGLFEGTVTDAVGEYRRRLDESVRLHLRSDVRVGSCLSGGLDSNIAAALATTHLTDTHLATFTAVYDDPNVDERGYVDLHAAQSERLRTHFVSPTAASLLAQLDRLVWAQEQPMASTSPFAQWSVMSLAAQHKIKVLLDGQGADEAIGGYSYFTGAYLLEMVRAGNPLATVKAARLLHQRRGVSVWHELSRAVYHQLPGRFRAPARRRTRAAYQLVAPQYVELIADAHQPALRTFRDHSLEAIRRSLPELLRYEDRSSMAFSIESRVPFLDHPLVEFVLRLPTHFKIRDGWSKFVQRKAAEDLLPNEIVWRRDKLGFATPQRTWRHALAAPLSDYVRSSPIPAFLDRARVERLISSDTRRPADVSEFWRTIFLLRWIEQFDVRFSD